MNPPSPAHIPTYPKENNKQEMKTPEEARTEET